ncbi:uncharacterized protein LOC111031288 [Myzus persicae]|uniref:uncharacterized protein LOC111031288 n=1 Tax=Myzus persicae TaxID=13164 RepID=UPI000B93991E|nr:uncharacterized protein LOC111031288 [Myzus persicae]
MTNKSDILLVSGAISNSLDKYKPIKLEGIPLILTKDDKLRRFWRCDLNTVVQTIKRIFRYKTELMASLLEQLYRGVNARGAFNLSTTYLQKYLHIPERELVIVFWNGSTDMTIIKRLRLRGTLKYLNLTAYSNKNNNEFIIKLINLENKEQLYSGYIGTINRNGRMLNLLETYGLVCNIDHNITHCHDPVADIILTKCIFNYVVNEIRPIKLYRLCRREKRQRKKKKYNNIFNKNDSISDNKYIKYIKVIVNSIKHTSNAEKASY